MSYSYEVYVGNLPTSITTEQLKDLFSQVGQVLNVWINQSNEKITYGFVEFDNVISAEDACKEFNELRLDFSHITVRISERTKNQSKLKIKTNQTTTNDNECYQVYVGNLSTTVTVEQLKDLFSQAGQVLHVWINQEYLKITYGFVKFHNLISAQNACKQFNGLELDNEYIIVRISKDEQKGNTMNYLPQRCGILLELPKKKKPSQEFLLKKALAKDLHQNRELGADFVNACIEMEQLIIDDKPEMIKTAPEEVNLDIIAQTIKRYYKPPLKKHNWEVDIDLSKGKLLTEQEYDKFFNLKLSKTLLRKPTPKKEKYYSLDYRSVND